MRKSGSETVLLPVALISNHFDASMISSVFTLPAVGDGLRVAVIDETERVVVRGAVEWVKGAVVDTISTTDVSL